MTKNLSDGFLIKLFNNRRMERVDGGIYDSEFSAKDLIGRTIIGVRDLDTGNERENPRYIRSLDFSDGSSLIMGSYGDGECGHEHIFLIDKNGRDLYSSGRKLFIPNEYNLRKKLGEF